MLSIKDTVVGVSHSHMKEDPATGTFCCLWFFGHALPSGGHIQTVGQCPVDLRFGMHVGEK